MKDYIEKHTPIVFTDYGTGTIDSMMAEAKARNAANELSKKKQRTIYVEAVRFGTTGTQYMLKTDEQIINPNSESIIHAEYYQPGRVVAA